MGRGLACCVKPGPVLDVKMFRGPFLARRKDGDKNPSRCIPLGLVRGRKGSGAALEKDGVCRFSSCSVTTGPNGGILNK